MNAPSLKQNSPLNQNREYIRKRKLARVWSLARDLGMGKDKDGDLYLIVESLTGESSLAVLNLVQLETVIGALEKLLSKQKNKRVAHDKNVAYLPTPAQRKLADSYLDKLVTVLRLNNPQAYGEAICEKTFRKEYKFLDRREMGQYIETLKSIFQREIQK